MTSEPPPLTGRLLLAHPHLRDPNFRRTIIYLARHEPLTGAFGFILNRPTDQTLGSIEANGISSQWAETPLYLGGPVGRENILLVTLDWDPLLKKTNISYTTDSSEAEPHRAIALLGYAGWSQGQLENEINEGSWLIRDTSDANAALIDAGTHTWKLFVSQISPQLHLLAEMPDNPGLN